ncbi:MAG: hypothetical protein KJ958_07035 [Gammaproteobacteria bacterium]|nr:hypothetical protein [Gammaproteobacteria bacterium]MBU1978905.1 hypothetical protein [Gammaproteobacteria bacterium]
MENINTDCEIIDSYFSDEAIAKIIKEMEDGEARRHVENSAESVMPKGAEPSGSYDDRLAHAQTVVEQIRQQSKQKATPKVAEIAPSPKKAEIKYPELPLDLSNLSHEHLVSMANELACRYRREKEYWEIRDEFVFVSLALNQYGLSAPAFRNQPRIPHFMNKRDDSHEQLLIDQIVIDCHWVYCSREEVAVLWPELKVMFDHESPFDCIVVCTQMAAKNWSKEFRADELLRLSNRQQHQLMQIRGEKLKDQYRRLTEGGKQLNPEGRSTRFPAQVLPIRKAITEWADRKHQVRGHQDMYQALWVARELLGSDAPIKHIADLAALQCGIKPLSARTVADKLKLLDTILDAAGIS